MVHGFSLKPDTLSISNGGREKSILLAHRLNGHSHLIKYNKNGFDSVIFTAEDFAEDLEKVLNKIFIDLAPNDKVLEQNILSWIKNYPPVAAIIV